MTQFDTAAPHPVDVEVGRRLAARRISMGLNQSELGRALGVTFQQIQKYEKGANRISASKLWMAAEALGVDIGYFFDALRGEALPATQPPVTRLSHELSSLYAQLAPSSQRLVIELARQLAPAKGDA